MATAYYGEEPKSTSAMDFTEKLHINLLFPDVQMLKLQMLTEGAFCSAWRRGGFMHIMLGLCDTLHSQSLDNDPNLLIALLPWLAAKG